MKKINVALLSFAVVLSMLLNTGCETTKEYSMKDRGSMLVNENKLNKQATEAWIELKRQVPPARNRFIQYRPA